MQADHRSKLNVLARRVLCATVFALFASQVTAHPKIDVLVLSNGDRITGEIKKLDRGILTFKTDSLSTLSVEWVDVARLTSLFVYQFELEDGTLTFGKLEDSSADGMLHIVGPEGLGITPVAKVVRCVPIDGSFWQRLDGSMSFGFFSDQSTDLTQWSAATSAVFRTRRFESTLDFSTIETDQDSGTTSRTDLTVGTLRLWPDHWFTGTSLTAQKNEELGIDLRLLLQGFGGRFLIDSNRSRLGLAGGFAVAQEEQTDSSDNEQTLEALVNLRYDVFRFKTPETNVSIELTVYENLQETHRLRSELSADIAKEIVKDFWITLSGYYSYDRDPPSDETENADHSVTLEIKWKF